MSMYQLSADTAITEVGDEYVMLDLKQGKYFSVNGVGRAMLDLIRKHDNKDAVIGEIVSQFDADSDAVSRDLDDFIVELTDAGIIITADSPAS